MFAYCNNNPVNYKDPNGTNNRSIWSLVSDWAGRKILSHWLFGGGKPIKEHNGKWGDYMKKNETLRTKIKAVVKNVSKNLKKIDMRLHMEIENGEDIIGYQYLHGSNPNVVDFQIKGMLYKDGRGNTTCNLTYTWNDIIDPNFQYSSHKKKADFAKSIPFANPTDYVISISWSDTTIMYSNFAIGTGWIY